MSFEQLGLIQPILQALSAKGYEHPTSIQQQAIPPILQQKDLLGCAQTGTGKTAAFATPILQLLYNKYGKTRQKPFVKALVLTPTRELAIQVEENFSAYGKFTGLKTLVVFGGVSQQPQVSAIQRGVDILIATPGRLLDLISQQLLSISQTEILVLDEADHMLDMGFIRDVKKIVQRIPAKRQTLLFSATMPEEIRGLANELLHQPVYVQAAPISSAAEKVDQFVYFVEKNNKRSLLAHLLEEKNIDSALVFTRTKHGADRVAKDLGRAGFRAEAIHGNKSQNARQRSLDNFKTRQTRVLVATDIAARGIDIRELPCVINFDLPQVPETYVHRIGRTGRAGNGGMALSFCDGEERILLKDIQKLLGNSIPPIHEQPYHDAKPVTSNGPVRKPVQQQRSPRPAFRQAAAYSQNRHGSQQRRSANQNS